MSSKTSRLLLLAVFALAVAGCDDADELAPTPSDAATMHGGFDAGATDGSADAGDPDADADAGGHPIPDAGDASMAVPDATIRIDAGRPSVDCDRYGEPFDRLGDEGLFVARFLAIEPELDARGRYDWTVELLTVIGEPLGDATLEATGFMPAHGHGTSPITVRHEAGSSRYELHDVNLFMAGEWEVRLTVAAAAGDDRIVFHACVRTPPDAGETDEDGGDSEG